MSVSRGITVSSIQWRANNRQGKTSVGRREDSSLVSLIKRSADLGSNMGHILSFFTYLLTTSVSGRVPGYPSYYPTGTITRIRQPSHWWWHGRIQL